MYEVDYKFGNHDSCGTMVINARDEEDAWAEAYCSLVIDNHYENVRIEFIRRYTNERN